MLSVQLLPVAQKFHNQRDRLVCLVLHILSHLISRLTRTSISLKLCRCFNALTSSGVRIESTAKFRTSLFEFNNISARTPAPPFDLSSRPPLIKFSRLTSKPFCLKCARIESEQLQDVKPFLSRKYSHTVVLPEALRPVKPNHTCLLFSLIFDIKVVRWRTNYLLYCSTPKLNLKKARLGEQVWWR